MRPVPKPRHLLAAAIIVAAAGIVAYLAAIDPTLSEVQVNIACAELKNHDHTLFAGDPVFGNSELWQFHTPVFQGVLELALVPTGYKDPTLPFRALAGLTALLLMGGMYALLFRQTRSWSISLFVAVLSMTVTEVLGRAFWGVGPLATITPPTIYLAMTPLIIMAYLNYEERWQIVLVFGFIGLMGNLHLVTAMNLTLVLLLVYLARHRFALSAWPTALACGVTALAAASPYALYYYGVRWHLTPTNAHVDVGAIYQAFQVGGQELLYPALLKGLLDWDLLIKGTILAVVAIMVLLRLERFQVRDRSFWLYMIIAVLVVSLGLQGLSQVVGILTGGYPPIIDFLKASPLVLLPLYVLLAQGLVNLARLWRAHRRLMGWLLALLMVAWMLTSDNFSQGRHELYILAGKYFKEQVQPRRFLEIQERRMRQQELRAIADWARSDATEQTPAATGQAATAAASAPAMPSPPLGRPLFVTDQVEFRMLSRRAILAAPEDVRFLYYLTPWRLDEWVQRYVQQQRIIAGSAEPAELAQFFARLAGQKDMRDQVDEYYIIFDASVPLEKYPALEIIKSDRWGRYLHLARVNLAALQSAAKPTESFPWAFAQGKIGS